MVGTYVVRFVVAQFIARPAGRLLACAPPAVLFRVETGNKLPYYELLAFNRLRRSEILILYLASELG